MYTSSDMVPLWYQHRPLRGRILGGSRGGKCTSEGWVYFKPKRGTRYSWFSRFFCKQPSWYLAWFYAHPTPLKRSRHDAS